LDGEVSPIVSAFPQLGGFVGLNILLRYESQKSDAGFENILQTADLDLKNLKNILETVNVVSALKKDFPDSENSRCADEKLQTLYVFVFKFRHVNISPEYRRNTYVSW
jgi:hypothetical protein